MPWNSCFDGPFIAAAFSGTLPLDAFTKVNFPVDSKMGHSSLMEEQR